MYFLALTLIFMAVLSNAGPSTLILGFRPATHPLRNEKELRMSK